MSGRHLLLVWSALAFLAHGLRLSDAGLVRRGAPQLEPSPNASRGGSGGESEEEDSGVADGGAGAGGGVAVGRSRGAACPAFENPDLDRLRERSKQGPVVPAAPSPAGAGRHYLFILCPPFSGSTALLGLIATSPTVSTHCAAEIRGECEGTSILIKRGLMTEDNRWSERSPADWHAAVRVYEEYWNMSQDVLVDKSVENIHKAKQIYEAMQSEGKNVSFVIMTRSPCYKVNNWARLRRFSRYLLDAKAALPPSALLHIRYEDLLRQPYAEASRIVDFLPALRSLDPSRSGVPPSRAHGERSKSLTDFVLGHGPFENSRTRVPGWVAPFMHEFGYGLDA